MHGKETKYFQGLGKKKTEGNRPLRRPCVDGRMGYLLSGLLFNERSHKHSSSIQMLVILFG
jgi:hypothetical protein